MLRYLLATLLKIAPLGLYVRAIACKLGLPVLTCDGPLCPLAIGQEATDGCTPTANTAELKAWCENAWTPWLNGLLATAAAQAPFLPQLSQLSVTCDEATGFILLKSLAVVLIVGYTLLWSSPRLGAFLLTCYMGFGIHFHLVALKETPEKIILQFGLLAASVLVLLLELCAPKKAGPPPKAKRA